MSQIDETRALSVESRLEARLPWRWWLGALAAFGLAAAVVWAGRTKVERWMMRATFRVVRDEEPKRLDDRLVGRWISPRGGRILISRSGVVWFEAGDLIGTGAFDATQPSRFVFAGPGFHCAYDLTAAQDVSDWHLIDRSAGTTCPEGRFVRTFAF